MVCFVSRLCEERLALFEKDDELGYFVSIKTFELCASF